MVPDRSPPRALVVYFHGAEGAASGGLRLWQDLSREVGLLVLLPDALGRTWDLIAGKLGPDVARIDHQLTEVFARYSPAHVALSGFSDGASYALSIGLANGDLVEQVLAFSPGFLAPPRRVGRPRVWLSHGTADPVLPIDVCGRRVARTLQQERYPVEFVEFVEFAGGHVVTPDLARAGVLAWLGTPDGSNSARRIGR